MVLPVPRTDAAEDAFVAALSGEADREVVAAAVSDAIAARRPRLAARLVALLDPAEDADDSEAAAAIARARQAAALLVVDTANPASAAAWEALEEEWARVRRDRLRKSRLRRRNWWSDPID